MALINRGRLMFDYLRRLGTKDTYKAKYEALEAAVDNAPTIDAVPLDRLGDFGKLFMDYTGCPRGAMGRACMPIEEEVLQMKPITDVDGGSWIPVNADALHELVKKYASLRDGGTQAVVLCDDCYWKSATGFCRRYGHSVADGFFCADGRAPIFRDKRPEKKTMERCLATGCECSRCMPGPCDHRRTVIPDDSGQ